MPQYPSYAGILHRFTSRLVAFEHQPPQSSQPQKPFPTYSAAVAAVQGRVNPTPSPTNFILFLGGLGDDLLTVNYTALLAKLLPPNWALVEVTLSCSSIGWTTSSLQKDAGELARAVRHFRDVASARCDSSDSDAEPKIVLMGHSTGCQISMEYVVGPWKAKPIPEATLARPKVDGVILQAGISDREGAADVIDESVIKTSLELAKDWIANGRGEDIIPLSATGGTALFGVQPCARRWVSLIDLEGDDDYFSNPSSVGDERVERVWGEGGVKGRGIPFLVLFGGSDEHMPAWVDKKGVLERWRRSVGEELWDGNSGVVEGAQHNLNKNEDEVKMRLCERVLGFVKKIDGAGVSAGKKLEGEKL